MSGNKRKPLGKAELTIGDTVLLGMPGISQPSEWHFGRVLWFDPENVLVYQSHIGGAGKPYPALHDITYIRAVGTVAELGDIRSRAEAAVMPLKQTLNDAEAALGEARAAIWSKLDDFAKAEPMRNAGDGI